jgi:hypothetical protein
MLTSLAERAAGRAAPPPEKRKHLYSIYLNISDLHAWVSALKLPMLLTLGISTCSPLQPREKKRGSFKGIVSRDFLLLVFFMNQFPPSPRVSH